MPAAGEPVPQLKLMLLSVRVITGEVKSELLKYSPFRPLTGEACLVEIVCNISGPRFPAKSKARIVTRYHVLGWRLLKVWLRASAPSLTQLPSPSLISYPATPTLSVAWSHRRLIVVSVELPRKFRTSLGGWKSPLGPDEKSCDVGTTCLAMPGRSEEHTS